MPYIVRPGRFPSGVVAACSAMLLLGAGSAQAATTASSTSQCTEPALTQPFLYANDTNYYTLTPGQSPGNFEGTGWALSGGASIKKTTLGNGKAGYVLNLPSGSKAVSPSFCTTSEFPTARTIVRNAVGSEGVFFYVSYEGTNTAEAPKNTGQVHGNGTEWTLSDPVNMQPENVFGWQHVRITLIPGGTASDFQLYNLYIDPYKR
jgi:hypothetical protein